MKELQIKQIFKKYGYVVDSIKKDCIDFYKDSNELSILYSLKIKSKTNAILSMIMYSNSYYINNFNKKSIEKFISNFDK